MPCVTRGLLILVAITSMVIMTGSAHEFIGDWEYPHLNKDSGGLDSATVSAIIKLDEQMKTSNDKTIKSDAKKFLAAESQKKFRKVVEKVIEDNKASKDKDSKKLEFEHRKIASAVGKLNDVYKRLQSNNTEVKLQAICELVAAVGDIIPGPVGTIVSTIANLGATIFGSHTEGTTSAIVRQVKNAINEQYATEVEHEARKEIEFIETEIANFDDKNTAAYKNFRECKDKFSKEAEFTDKDRQDCLDSAITEADKSNLNSYLADQEWGKSQLSTIKLAVSDQVAKTGSFEHMKQLHGLTVLYIHLKTLRFMLHEQIENFLTAYMKNLTHPIIRLKNFDEKEGIRFDNWVDLNFNQPFTKKGAILALYLIHDPIPGMEEAAEKILAPMKTLMEKSQKRPLTWDRMSLDDAGWLESCDTAGEVTGGDRSSGKLGVGYQDTVYVCPEISVYLQAYDSKNLAKGATLVFANSGPVIVGINDKHSDDGYLQKFNMSDNAALFVMVPLENKWVLMPTSRHQPGPNKFFSLVQMGTVFGSGKYPYAPKKNFDSFEIDQDELVHFFH